MTKSDLAKLVLTDDELKHIDYALPQNFVEDCENFCAIDPRPFFVWAYWDGSVTGMPVNLAELYVSRYLGKNIMHGNIVDANERIAEHTLEILNKINKG